jgi:VCBS repeat-containing protein
LIWAWCQEYFNPNQPTDVNADGRVTAYDALMVINELNRRLVSNQSSLLAPKASFSTSGAEGEASDLQFYDVNNDGRVTAYDALSVINDLNAEGEDSDDRVAFEIHAYLPGTDTPVSEVARGDEFDVVIKVDDLREFVVIDNVVSEVKGFVTAQFDILHDTSKVELQAPEVRYIQFTSQVANHTTGTPSTFTLTFNGQTTAPIQYTSNAANMITRIQTALDGLNNVDPLDVEVTPDYYDSAPRRYMITFRGQYAGTDIPTASFTADPTNLAGPAGKDIFVTTLANGTVNDPVGVRESFRTYVIPDVVFDKFYFDRPAASIVTEPIFDGFGQLIQDEGFNDVSISAALQTSNYPGNALQEYLRFRVKAVDGGDVTFSLDRTNVDDDDVLLFDEAPVPLTQIAYRIPAVTVTIIEAVTAVPDTATVTESNPAGVTITPLTNDTIVSGTKQIPPFAQFTTVNGGVVQRVNSTTIRYTNTTDFNGPDEFSYTLSDGLGNTDTGTIEVTVTPVNDAPTIDVPAAGQSVLEDEVFFFAPGNSIVVSDVDADSGATFTVTLATSQGILSISELPGVTTTNNASSSVTLVGSRTVINEMLETLEFEPTANFNGTATIAITANDGGSSGAGGAQQALSNFTLAVGAVNDAPTLTVPLDVLMGFENELLDLGSPDPIVVGDIDVGTGVLEITILSSNGTLTAPTPAGATGAISGNGTAALVLTGSVASLNAALLGLEYLPNLGFFGAAELQVVVSDLGNTGNGGPLTATEFIFIDVQPDVRPRARNDARTVAEGNSITVDVLANDEANPADIDSPAGYFKDLTDFDSAAMAVIGGNSVQVGTITRVEAGLPGTFEDQLLYTPDAGFEDFFGTVTFGYTMTDDKIGSIPVDATVTLTVTNVNDAPIANDDSYSTNEDVALVVPVATGLLDNDEDIDSTNLTVTVTVQPTSGTLVWNANGSFTYTPNANFNGNDEFQYTVSDGQATSAPATAFIVVNPVNDRPTANSNFYSTQEDTLLNVNGTIAFPSVLANDTDVDGDTLTAVLVVAPSTGTLNFNEADGTFTYLPPLNFSGNVIFYYRAFDGELSSSPKQVTIIVIPVNDAPVGVANSYVVEERQTLTVAAAQGVLANDTDVDSTNLTAVLVSTTANGTLNFNANGSFNYTPNTGFLGNDTFTYRASDGSLTSDITTVTITVTDVNDPPVAVADVYTTLEDTQLVVPGAGLLPTLLANDTDPESPSSSLIASLVSGPASGNLVLNANGTFTYTPAANANGQVTFTYRVSDGALFSAPATVTINITPVNDAPIVTNKEILAVKDIDDQPFTIVNATDTDVDGNNLVIAGLSATNVLSASNSIVTANGGTVTIDGQKGILYTPAVGYEGDDSFFYTVTDGTAQVVARVDIDVIAFRFTDVSGTVYVDADNDGTIDGDERRLAGMEVRLVGTDFQGNAVSTPYAITDADGFYMFSQVKPGNYVIEQLQPGTLRDGKETAGLGGSLISGSQNIAVELPILGILGGSTGHNFGELGVDAAGLTNSAGLVNEMLASSGHNGVVFEIDSSGNALWFYQMTGWSGLESMSFNLASGFASAQLYTNGHATGTTVYQAPASSAAGSPRFRILGTTSTGGYIIRLDGTSTGFGVDLSAAEVPEGEPSDPAMEQYQEAVDAAFGDGSAWA